MPQFYLVYPAGQRPDAKSLGVLANEEPAKPWPPFAVTHVAEQADWAELLCRGLVFDCAGLAPGTGQSVPVGVQLIGLSELPSGEGITLTPGPHLAGTPVMAPVLRQLAGLAARLILAGGVTGVMWAPADTWIDPITFCREIGDWLRGGVFPALALTRLDRLKNGAMVSRGLDAVLGQELRFEPDRQLPPAAQERIAVRVIDALVANGPLLEGMDFIGPGGEPLLALPVQDGRQVRVILRRQV